MRRLAAVFASKRSDRSDAASSAPSALEQPQAVSKSSSSKRFFRSISRKTRPVDPVVNRLNSADLHPPSSSSSSSGAPTTPDDDRGSLLRAPASKAWLPIPHSSPDSSLGSFHRLDSPHDSPGLSIPPRLLASPSTLDTEDDSSEESSVALDLSSPPERSTPLAPSAYLLALTSSNLRPPFAPPPLLHIPAHPIYPRSCNPPSSLPYADSLQSTMHRTRLHRHLQRGYLSPSDSRSIASFSGRRSAIKERLSLQLDDTAVREGHVRLFSAGLKRWADRPCFEDRMLVILADNPPASTPTNEPRWTRIQPATSNAVAALEYSLTLELLAGFYADDLPRQQEHDRPEPVPDTSALGYLRLDTQLTLDLAPSLPHSPLTLSPSSANPPSPAPMPSATPSPTTGTGPKPAAVTVLSPPSSHTRGQLYKANPSPLRMEATSVSSPTSDNAQGRSPAPRADVILASMSNPPPPVASRPLSSAPVPLKSALKQGVRFAEEDKDDQVPLGDVMRIKRHREDKVRFLKAENDRRKHEEERRMHAEEKRRWQEESARWEREKLERERERVAMAEDRKKRLYADEVAAARSRRDSQRFGPLGAMTGEGLATGQWDRGDRGRSGRQPSSSGAYTRARYDPAPASHPPAPASQGSDSSLTLPKTSRRASGSGSGSASPGDSRPNSVHGAGSVNGSRPPSMHSGVLTPSSSQQDIRSRERRMSGAGSRQGSESGGSRRQSAMMVPVPPLPVWNVGPNPMVPWGVPMYGMGFAPMTMGSPMYDRMATDGDLLPPSPPFMQHSGHRSSGGHSGQPNPPQRSHSSSPTLGRQNLSAAGSSERVNRLSQARGPSSTRAPSLPRSESAPQRSQHQRTSSGEITQRPGAGNSSRAEDGRNVKASAPSRTQRPTPTHSSSLPPHPPPVFSQARSSWALPQSNFENLSRPGSGRRQTIIS